MWTWVATFAQTVDPSGIEVWIPSLIQAGGLGFLLFLLLRRILITQAENEQTIKSLIETHNQSIATIKEVTTQILSNKDMQLNGERELYRAQIAQLQANAAKWESIATEQFNNLEQLRDQLQLALKALLALQQKGST